MSQNHVIVNITMAHVDAGRPPLQIDWGQVDFLILAEMNISQMCDSLNVSRNALNSASERDHTEQISEYIKQRKSALFNVPGRFSVTEVKQLLTVYYTRPHILNTVNNKARKPGKGPDPFQAPTTGTPLFSIVTYPQLEAVLTELKRLSFSLDGVAVRDGYEYPLRVWVRPKTQSKQLAPLMEFSQGRERWEMTDRGEDVIKNALCLFYREFYKQILNRGKPHG